MCGTCENKTKKKIKKGAAYGTSSAVDFPPSFICNAQYWSRTAWGALRSKGDHAEWHTGIFHPLFCFQTKRPIRLKNGQLGKQKTKKKTENHTTTNLPGQKLLMFNIVACWWDVSFPVPPSSRLSRCIRTHEDAQLVYISTDIWYNFINIYILYVQSIRV